MALPKLTVPPRTLSTPLASPPCALQSDGARRLARPAWRLLASGTLAVALLTGCAQHTFTALGSLSPQPLPPATQRSQPITQRQLAGAVPDWNAVFQKWWQAATKPQPATSSPAKQPAHPVVFINVAVIAAHHPAWRLAAALERSGSTSLALAALPAPATVAGLPPQPVMVPFGPLTVGVPGGVPGFYRAAKTVTVRDLDQLQTVAYQRQAGALRDFIGEVVAYQTQNRAAQALTLNSALTEDIEAAQRLNLATLTPTLPSDPIQLEMTNLRLALLKNLYATAQEKAQARQRLSALEAQWEAKLRSQENQRLDELARLRQERPRRLRQAGETRINATLSAIEHQDTVAREAILRTHNTLVAANYAPDTTRLGIVLPAAALPAQRLEGLVAPPLQRQAATAAKISETILIKITSRDTERRAIGKWPRAPQSKYEQSGAKMSQAATIQALRAQAWQDARRWAGIAARRAGWTWQEVRAGQQGRLVAPDRTQAALRLLNLS